MIKRYKYPLPKNERFVGRLNRPEKETHKEGLSGFVDGEPASDIEERFSIALRKNPRVTGFDFQPSYLAGRNMPGEVRLDFMVYSGFQFPIQVDGEYAHKGASQKSEDAMKDALLDVALHGSGAMPVERIDFSLLKTQDDTDRLVFRKW